MLVYVMSFIRKFLIQIMLFFIDSHRQVAFTAGIAHGVLGDETRTEIIYRDVITNLGGDTIRPMASLRHQYVVHTSSSPLLSPGMTAIYPPTLC